MSEHIIKIKKLLIAIKLQMIFNLIDICSLQRILIWQTFSPTLFIPDHFLLNTRDKSENMFVNYNLYRNDIVEIKLFNGG